MNLKRWLNRESLLSVALVAVTLGLAAWLATVTEWVEVDVPVPPRGEAAKNPLYATQQLARRLGAEVSTPSTLAVMPPPHATLLLTSWYWDLFPERAQRLKDWVDAGGHLVIHAGNLDHDQLKGWLPITERELQKKKDGDDDATDADDDDEDESDTNDPEAKPAEVMFPPRSGPPCHTAIEPDTVPAAYANEARHYQICTYPRTDQTLQSATPPLWSLDGPTGPILLRAARGQGQVTVIQPWGLLDNDRVLKGDNALAAVAALQARAGASIWFVTEEARPPLLTWLWREAWVVLALGATALVLALWRAARRFGPPMGVPASGRRSMAEQITGTAQFLRRQGPEALLGAQIRALETAARQHVRQFDTLDRTQRAAAISRATGLDATSLGLALDKRLARRRVDLGATLELLETARRILAQHSVTPRRK